MKEQEAIKILFRISLNDKTKEKESDAIGEAIVALKEIKKYRALGTLEEVEEAITKQKPTKPYYADFDTLDEPLCPYCHGVIEDGDVICDCGQRIDWSM